MDNLKKVKSLFEKYLNRTASSEELDEMFQILQNKSNFESLHKLFEEEWESQDVQFYLDHTSWEDMQSRMDERKKVTPSKSTLNTIDHRRFWRIAAVAASILLLAGSSLWLVRSTDDRVYETGFGETLEVTLDDQSHVILNANSKLTWHMGWQNAKERWAELEGEAYFVVSHQALSPIANPLTPEDSSALIPFRVITPDLTVNVLGTTFNVMARRQTTDVYLESGQVVLTMNHDRKYKVKADALENSEFAVNSDLDSIYMRPGDHVSYSGRSSTLAQINSEPDHNKTSWTNGNLVFENQPLKTALQELEDIYGKNFEIEDSTLLNRTVDLGLPYKDWETVSGLMTLSLEIEFIETANKVKVKRK